MIGDIRFVTAEIQRVNDLLDQAGAPTHTPDGAPLSMSQRLELYLESVRALTAKRF